MISMTNDEQLEFWERLKYADRESERFILNAIRQYTILIKQERSRAGGSVYSPLTFATIQDAVAQYWVEAQYFSRDRINEEIERLKR